MATSKSTHVSFHASASHMTAIKAPKIKVPSLHIGGLGKSPAVKAPHVPQPKPVKVAHERSAYAYHRPKGVYG